MVAKIILITGGVVSGIGKGIITASLGYLLQESGFAVTCIKIDPYLNVDAGTMSPYEHGEVFVLEDGGEVDLDLGNYERYLDVTLTKDNNITSGKIFNMIIQKERAGDYLGKTVQFVPHVTNLIKDWILRISTISVDKTSREPQICLIELGGTPGDIESMMFFEALRQLMFQMGSDKFLHIHLTYIPTLTITGEQKSKPSQQNILDLRKSGINPQIIICRSKDELNRKIVKKISLYGMVPKECVLSIPDLKSTFEIPFLLLKQELPNKILNHFGYMSKIDLPVCMMKEIIDFQKNRENLPKLRIGFIGKYLSDGSDCYISLLDTLKTVERKMRVELDIISIEASDFEKTVEGKVENYFDGILIPGGFGNRGIEGKVLAVNYARKRNIPFLGICLGMQVAVIEFARNELGMKDANSSEFEPESESSVIIWMPEIEKGVMGGNMRVGARETRLKSGSLISKIYGGEEKISERYRHRYEVNPKIVPYFKDKGFVFTGKDITGKRMGVFEFNENKFHVGVQFHPEFQNNPRRPAPVILSFIGAVFEQKWGNKLVKN